MSQHLNEMRQKFIIDMRGMFGNSIGKMSIENLRNINRIWCSGYLQALESYAPVTFDILFKEFEQLQNNGIPIVTLDEWKWWD